MARPSFSDYRSLDVIGNNSFEAIITDIPGASGVEKKLSIQCKGFTMPGLEISRLEVIIQGFRFFNSAGSTVFPGQFTITYLEDSSYTVHKALRAWKEICAGTISGTTGGSKADYSRDILLRQFNPAGEPVGSITMIGCFPMVLPDNPLESTQTPTSTEMAVTFSFDMSTLEGVTNR